MCCVGVGVGVGVVLLLVLLLLCSPLVFCLSVLLLLAFVVSFSSSFVSICDVI